MNIFGIGFGELLFILVVALLVLGPGRMVELARNLGRQLRELQRAASEVPRLFSLDEEPPPVQRQQTPEGQSQEEPPGSVPQKPQGPAPRE